MVYFQDSYQAKAKPSEDANSTVMFRKGEKAQILKLEGNWALVDNSNGSVGWVERAALSALESVQRQMEEIMPQIIAHLDGMKAKYQQGPIRVTGFSIDIKLPPGVSVEFEFK
jgi:SH3-like domain-containing protein